MRAAGHAVTFLAVDPSDPPRFVEELRRLGIETYPGDPDTADQMGRTTNGRVMLAPSFSSRIANASDFGIALVSCTPLPPSM